jgi:hypothetical protein
MFRQSLHTVGCTILVRVSPAGVLTVVLSPCVPHAAVAACLLQLHADLEKANLSMSGVDQRIRDLMREVDTVAAAVQAYATTATDPQKGLRQVCGV